MELAPCLDLPSPLLHLDPELFDEFRDLLGSFLFPFVLHLPPSVLVMVPIPCVYQLGRWCVGRSDGGRNSETTGRSRAVRGIGGTKGQLVLVGVKAVHGFTVVVRVRIVLDREAEPALVLHEIGAELDGSIE